MLPNLRHMRVFLETVRHGSVSRAAELCLLSQPAATQAIGRLERELGTGLLVRRARALTPTPAGEVLAARIETALAHLSSGARIATRGHKHRAHFDRLVTSAQLRTLIAISATGSFTVAAHELGLAQPTVHRAARSLEGIAGMPFFRATMAGVELTPAAQAFAMGAKLAQSEIRQGIEEIGHLLGEDRGTFVLGSLPLARSAIVPRAVHQMITETDSVQIRVVDGRYGELLRALREGEIDALIGALRDPVPADDVVQVPLFDDALSIVAHPTHPLVERSQVTLEDTLRFPWVAPPRQTPAGSYLFNTLNIGEQARTPVRVVSSSMAMLRGILAQGPYVSIVSRHQIAGELRDGHMALLPVRLENNARPIGLTLRSAWRPTPTQARFLTHLTASARETASAQGLRLATTPQDTAK